MSYSEDRRDSSRRYSRDSRDDRTRERDYRSSRDSRQSSSRSSHYRSRRSPSPGPSRSRGSSQSRDPETLPLSFGRIQDSGRGDDDLNILQRMKSSFKNSPLTSLCERVEDCNKIKVWTRNYKEVRSVITGHLVCFDKHWNLILRDVDEVAIIPKKSKTPFLRDVEANEDLPDIPVKVPRQKKTDAEKAASAASQPKPPEPKKESEGKSKPPRRKKNKAKSSRRHVGQIFIRGDNVVMISSVLKEEPAEEVEEEPREEGEENRTP